MLSLSVKTVASSPDGKTAGSTSADGSTIGVGATGRDGLGAAVVTVVVLGREGLEGRRAGREGVARP